MAGTRFSTFRRGASVFAAVLLTLMALAVINPPSASAASELTIDKTAPSAAAPGDLLTYTITVTNPGGAKVTEVTLTDAVDGLAGEDGTNPTSGTNPLVVTSSGSSSNSGSCGQSANTVVCNKSVMNGFETWTVTISGIVLAPDGTTLHNTATVTNTKSATTYTASDTVSTRIDSRAGEPAPDLSLNIKAPNTIQPSHDLVYTVTVPNLGSVPASDVVLAISMPNSVTFITEDATNLFDCQLQAPGADTTTLLCTGGAINDGQHATVQVGVETPSFDTPITVTAMVDPADAIFETNEENNAAQATTTNTATPPPDDLVLEKTDTPDPISPTDTLTYRIRLTNTSANRADYVEIVDGTNGLDAASVTATVVETNKAHNAPDMVCTVAAPTVTCSTTRMQPSVYFLIEIKGRVVAKPGDTIINTATVNGNIRNTGITRTASTITVVKPSIDLTVTQHRTAPAAPAPVRAAALFDYTITVGNSGLKDATNVLVREPLPSGVFLDAFSASPTVDGATTCAADLTQVVTCTIPRIQGSTNSGSPGGTTETITLTLNAPQTLPSTTVWSAIGPIASTVTVDPFNTIPENFEDNNTATTTTDVVTGVDLTIAKVDDFDPVARNGELKYTLTITNDGTQDATNVVARDVLPTGTVFRSATDIVAGPVGEQTLHNFTCSHSGGVTGADGVSRGGVVECVGGLIEGTYSGVAPAPQLEAVDFAQIEIRVFAPDEPGVIHNEARVDPLNAIPEIDETDNLVFEDTTVVNTHGDDPCAVGGCGIYKELFISAIDENPTEDADKPGGVPYATAGVLNYDITTNNIGSADTYNVVVRMELPSGSTYRAANDAAGAGDGSFTCSHAGGIVTCSGGTITAGGSRGIKLETFAPPTPGTALLKAMIDPANAIGESDESNNTADETTRIEAGESPAVQGTYIDLKVVDPPGITDNYDPVSTSGTLDYTIPINNLGSADAFNVKFVATLPTGSVFRSADDLAPAETASAFNCTHSNGVVTCTGGRVVAGGARSVMIKLFAPEQPSTSDPTTQAHLVVQVDPNNAIAEGHEGNNSAEEFTKVAINGDGGYIDLKVTGTATIRTTDATTSGAVIPGGRITYHMLVKNDGTDDAINVNFRDWLPTGMKFVSATSDVTTVGGDENYFLCGHSNGVIDCSGGYVPGTKTTGGAEGVRTITIVADAPLVADLQIVNQAKVDPSETVAEQSEVNNVAQVLDQVKSVVDLVVDMQDGTAAGSGTDGHWILTAKNTNGEGGAPEANSRASNVVVVANFSGGSIHIDTATPGMTGWNCEVFENPVNQVRCVGNFSSTAQEVTIDVHYFQTSDEAIHGFAEVDPEEDTADAIVGRAVEIHEDNNTDASTG